MNKPSTDSQRKPQSKEEYFPQPLLVSKRSAAALLSVCVRTVDHLIGSKQLNARRIGKRVLIPYTDLIQFARRDHITSGQAQ